MTLFQRRPVELNEPEPEDASLNRLSRRQALQRVGAVVVASSLIPSALADTEPDDDADDFRPRHDIRKGLLNLRDSGLPRTHHTCTFIKKKTILVAGGENIVDLSSAEMFYPATNQWWDVASMNTARTLHAAALLRDGRVLVCGGAIHVGNVSLGLNSVEIYNPASDSWITVASMNIRRFGHGAVTTPDGKVIVTGGQYAGIPLASIEIYNPDTNTWTLAGA